MTPDSASRTDANHVLALSGGVGGAKLACGLAAALPPAALTVACNTADDFEHLGLLICPDLDSVVYALAGRNDPVRGWGLAGESWQMINALGELGGETWFNLGDRDLATHLYRTQLLRQGLPLTEVSGRIARSLGVDCTILPMSDERVSTQVLTDAGEMPFQHYFVREQCRPVVRAFRFEGVERARPQPAMMELLDSERLRAVVICPSNPFVSVDPILALPGVRAALRDCRAPVIAVSPIVGGNALKGPAGKMLRELGLPCSAAAVAAHYRGLIDGFVIDEADAALAPEIEALGMAVAATPSIMKSAGDRERLARFCLDFAADL